jgi:hypothetical protein
VTTNNYYLDECLDLARVSYNNRKCGGYGNVSLYISRGRELKTLLAARRRK